MTDKSKKVGNPKTIQSDIDRHTGRLEMITDSVAAHQRKLIALLEQTVNNKGTFDDAAIEDLRTQATASYEAFLDTTIYIKKLTRKLTDLQK
jgi:hypothetical protein